MRRDLGLICLGSVALVIGVAFRAGAEDTGPLEDPPVADTIGVVLASVGAWTCLICLVLIGVRLFRSR